MIAFKKLLLGALVTATLAAPVLTPVPAQAWWGPHGGWHAGWGWHPGWGWRGGVYVGGPTVVVSPGWGAPYRFIPGHYNPWGAWVPAHWGYY